MKQYWVHTLVCMAGILTPSLFFTGSWSAYPTHHTSGFLAADTMLLSQSVPDSSLNVPAPSEGNDQPINAKSGSSPSSSLIVLNPTSLVLQGRKGGYWFNRDAPSLRRNLMIRFTQPPKFVRAYVSDFKDPDGDKVYPTEYITCEAASSENDVDDVDIVGRDRTSQSPCHLTKFPVPQSDILNSNNQEAIFSLNVHFDLLVKGVVCQSQPREISTTTTEKNAATTNPSCQKKTRLERPPSGEFSGEILMITSTGQEIVVPVLLRIQDGWILPLVLLICGVGMGMAVSAYSTGGKLSDEVTVGLKRLRSQVTAYRQNAKTFAVRVETYISDAESANEAKQLTEAQAAVNQANLVWRKWYRQRTEWDAQFAYHHQLMDQVKQELDHYSSLYMQTISRDLEDMIRRAPEDFANPGALRVGLQGIANQLREYGQVKTLWNQVKELVRHEFDQVPETERKKINEDITTAKQLIETVTPSDSDEISDLKTRLPALVSAIKKAANTTIIPVLGGKSETDAGDADETRTRIVSNLTMIPSPSTSVPSVEVERSPTTLSWLEKLQTIIIWPDADGRLRSFYIASYVGSVVMLSSAGFSSLYLENPIFGANFFADYFSMIAWGFGAEATRDTVTKVVRKTDQTNQ